MTAPTEPLVMTLEGAMQHLAASKMWLESLSPQQWVVYAWDDVLDEPTGVALGSTWWEAVSEALNRPVVARDDAAELRAALVKMVDQVGYRTLDWAGTVCAGCGADQPNGEHWDDCVVLEAEAALAASEEQS